MKQSQPVPVPKSRRRIALWQSLLLVFGGLLLLSVAVLSLQRRTPGSSVIEVHGAPSLRANLERIDLGTVKVGQPVEASFTLTNVGDRPLEFTKAPYIEVVEGC